MNVVDSKRDLSEKINGLLGLEPAIDFGKLKLKDLQRLYEVLSKIPSLVQVGARASLERVMQGPAVTATREILNMRPVAILRELRESGGVIGLVERRMKQQRGEARGKGQKPSETA